MVKKIRCFGDLNDFKATNTAREATKKEAKEMEEFWDEYEKKMGWT